MLPNHKSTSVDVFMLGESQPPIGAGPIARLLVRMMLVRLVQESGQNLGKDLVVRRRLDQYFAQRLLATGWNRRRRSPRRRRRSSLKKIDNSLNSPFRFHRFEIQG